VYQGEIKLTKLVFTSRRFARYLHIGMKVQRVLLTDQILQNIGQTNKHMKARILWAKSCLFWFRNGICIYFDL